MNSLVRRVKKIHPQKGDFVIVTLKGDPSDYQMQIIRNKFTNMPFLTGVYVLFVNDMIIIREQKANKGKHAVYLNNLEYLEYVSKKKETK